MSAFTTMTTRMGAKPNENIGISERTRRFEDKGSIDEEAKSIWNDPIGWILEQGKSNTLFSKQLDAMLDKDLPERLVNLVDNGNDDATIRNQNGDCVKQLLCKTAPFIWSMQKAVSNQINKSDDETSESDDTPNDNAKQDDNRMNIFFKYLPSVDEFKNHGVTCEDQHKQCKLF